MATKGTEERYQRALAKRKELFGEILGRGPADELAPDILRLVDEVLFGEIWTRPALDMKSRSMCTIAALTVLGREFQLRRHIQGALNIGITKQQVVEILCHMAFYGGLPVTVNGLRVAKEVFDTFKPPRRRRGRPKKA
jgi:4-carboxymuconolactone decarboxylase